MASEPPNLPSDNPGVGVGNDAAASGQRAYVTLLFNKYRDALHRYLKRLVPVDDAAELVQESYFRLLRHGDTVQLEAMARSFLFQTATNLARDHRRRWLSHQRDHHVSFDDDQVGGRHDTPYEQLFGEQLLAGFERALLELPDEIRTVFLMHRFRELTYPQIATRLKVSERTVARRMAEAAERLSAVLRASP
jgi:RNA polymerase sigma-70 factor (ECF subfamily)